MVFYSDIAERNRCSTTDKHEVTICIKLETKLDHVNITDLSLHTLAITIELDHSLSTGQQVRGVCDSKLADSDLHMRIACVLNEVTKIPIVDLSLTVLIEFV